MDQDTIDRVQSSWAAVVPIASSAGALFYDNLFAADPALKPLFRGDMAQQAARLVAMVDAAVGKLGDLPTLVPILQDLGRRHVRYGVLPEHYATVGAALLKTLEQGLGDAFTPEVRSAWTTTYGVMADTMITAGKGH